MLLGCALGWPIAVRAQLQRTPKQDDRCICENLPPTKSGFFIDQQKAIELVGRMLAEVQKHSQIRFKDDIQVKETDCPSPYALLCDVTRNKRVTQERIIIYNNKYLNKITQTDAPLTWVDRHVLAHEVGHHVLGHLGGTRAAVPTNPGYDGKTQEADATPSQHEAGSSQARELEADFFGLWLLSHTVDRFSFPVFKNSFDTTYVRTAGAGQAQNQNAYSSIPGKGRRRTAQGAVKSGTHPPFGDRLEAMEQFWKRLQAERRTVGRAGYFATEATAAYIRLNPEHTFYDLALVVGSTVAGQPVFRFAGSPVDALLYPVTDTSQVYVGVAFSRFNWQNALRIEGEVAWSQQRYGTTSGSGPGKRLLEKLDLRYLTVYPKLTWSPFSRDGRGRTGIRRLGFFTSVGPSVRIPLGFRYQNNIVQINEDNQPDLQWSVSPRLSIGVELLKKTFQPRGYKIALNYEYQRIRLDATPRPRMLSHNLDATFYHTLFRR